MTTEDKIQSENAAPAQISLTDCLACSGCVTSAEAVLVSLQSHSEILNALDSQGSINLSTIGIPDGSSQPEGKLFVASVSPQVRASIAATYGVAEAEAGWMIDQLLGGPRGLSTGGKYGNGFTWIVDTNAMREASLVLGGEEVMESLHIPSPQTTSKDDGASQTSPTKPLLSSACPGWICYAEKTHPHILPHLSRLKSPQALTGTLLKTILSRRLNIRSDQIWHVSIMPCFDKKLEASREELTDIYWRPPASDSPAQPVRDVDCVITARELLMLADTRGISFPTLPRTPLSQPEFPDAILSSFLFPKRQRKQAPEAGTSGGYLHHILQTQLTLNPSSTLNSSRGRNADIVEYVITIPDQEKPIFKAARYYGFLNIQNLVRKLKPQKKSRLGGRVGARAGATAGGGGGRAGMDYAYVEVMACPGGCTNGGGQIKVDDIPLKPEIAMSQKEWLGRIDEAYYSMSDHESDDDENNNNNNNDDDAMNTNHSDNGKAKNTNPTNVINGIDTTRVRQVLHHWAQTTGIDLHKLVTTSYRQVESDVGKVGSSADNERALEVAGNW